MKKEVSYDEKRCRGIRKTLGKKNQFQMDRLYEKLMKRPDDSSLAKKIEKGKRNDKKIKETEAHS